MAELSPAATSIVQAFDDRYELLGGLEEDWQEDCLAAARLAAVDQARRGPEHREGSHPDDFDNGWNEAMGWVAIIAAELEGSN